VAEKLGLTQITYTEEILECTKDKIVAKRHIDGVVETVEGPMPIVVTVNGSAAPCRSRNAKLVMKYKKAKTPQEIAALTEEEQAFYAERPYLNIKVWGAADIEADPAQIGKAGSPTNVKSVKNIVFKAKENKTLTDSDADVESLIVELLESNTIG
jgi:electron transfer flavoprotein beta subunit